MLDVSVVPKATLRVDDSLERLTEFRNAIITSMFKLYYSKQIQIKISKGNCHLGASPRENSSNFQWSPLSGGTRTVLGSPSSNV